jgi:hypothetical protein
MPTIRAPIRLLPAEQSGRSSSVSGSYRPNHNFFSPNNLEMATGFIDFAPGEALAPGEARLLDVQFIAWPDGMEFAPGRMWRIQEGPRPVGWGKIVSGS